MILMLDRNAVWQHGVQFIGESFSVDGVVKSPTVGTKPK